MRKRAMKVHFSSDDSIEGLRTVLESSLADRHCRSLLVLGSIQNRWSHRQASCIFRGLEVPCFGGLFPALIHEGALFQKGVMVIALPFDAEVKVLSAIDARERIDVMTSIFTKADTKNLSTIFSVVDSSLRYTSTLVERIYQLHGLEGNFIGGGAGAIGKRDVPCVISNRGLHAGVAVLAKINVASAVGIAHGWEAVSDVMRITDVEANVLREIDYRPAEEAYKSLVESIAGAKQDWSDFYSISSAYPFGMRRMSGKVVVRDPVECADGNLLCVGEFPSRSFVTLLSGNTEKLIEAARQAMMQSSKLSPQQYGFRLIFNCVSRQLFLGPRFVDELNVLHNESLQQVGALSIGEIANNGLDFLEFYNKTCVVCDF